MQGENRASKAKKTLLVTVPIDCETSKDGVNETKAMYSPHLFLVILSHLLIVYTASLAMNIYKCDERDDKS